MQDLIDASIRFPETLTKITRAFAKSKPWRGTLEERIKKFETYHAAMIVENDLKVELMFHKRTITDKPGASGRSFLAYLDQNGRVTRRTTSKPVIVMVGRLSVVTYLFLFGLAIGYDRTKAMRFAVNLFKQRFPRSFAACRMQDGLLIH